MKNSKYILLALIFICFQHEYNFAQSGAINHDQNGTIESSIALGTLSMNNFKINSLKYDDIKGSPYLEKENLSGYLFMIEGQKSETVPMQHDIYSNEFFYINEKGEELLIDLKLVKEIVLQGEEESYYFKRINSRNPHKFYEVLYESDAFDIYNDLQINFYEGKEQGITKIDPRFSRDDNYFVQKKGDKPKKIKLKKKDIYKLFGKEEQNKMDKLSKAQKIKLKKSKDFKKLFDLMKKN